MPTLLEIGVEVSLSVSVNYTFLKLLSYKPLYKIVCLLALFNPLHLPLKTKLKTKLYKGILSNLKAFILEYTEYIRIFKPNLKEKYLYLILNTFLNLY